MANKILFVCTGNTCRSYMAEAIARDYLQQATTLSPVPEIISAGTAAFDGEPPSLSAETVLAEAGIEAGEHRALTVTRELIGQADLILTMTEAQKASILRLEPPAKAKVFLLKDYAANNEGNSILRDEENGEESSGENSKKNSLRHDREISDPFGLPLEYYRECAVELRGYVIKALHRYLRL